MRQLLRERPAGTPSTGSALEVRVLQALRRLRLDAPVRQFEIRDAGELVARVDFAYPELKLAIEVESYRWHSGRPAFEDDLARRNRLQTLGWRVLHVTSRQLKNPKALADMLQAFLCR